MRKKIKWISICFFCIFIFLFGCTKEEVIVTTPEVTPQPTPTPLKEWEEHVKQMDDYIDLEVALLGCTFGDNRTVLDILERAYQWEEFHFIGDIDEDRIFYGDLHDEFNFVYLIVPDRNVSLKLGRYSYGAGEITEVFHEETNAKPFVFVESSESISPLSRIDYQVKNPTKSYDGFMYMGLSAYESKLRTAYHMGIVDTSIYDRLEPEEKPFYGQMFLEKLHFSVEAFREVLEGEVKGEIHYMDEFIFDGDWYSIYTITRNGKTDQTLYGIYYDVPTSKYKIIQTDDSENWRYIHLDE